VLRAGGKVRVRAAGVGDCQPVRPRVQRERCAKVRVGGVEGVSVRVKAGVRVTGESGGVRDSVSLNGGRDAGKVSARGVLWAGELKVKVKMSGMMESWAGMGSRRAGAPSLPAIP
jgi:hypothetical protein